LKRICPQGRGKDAARFSQGLDAPAKNPVSSLRSAGNKRMWGGLFFGFFLLAEHKFVRNEFEQPIGWPAE